MERTLDESEQDQNQESEAAPLSCPKCGSHDVRRSKSEGLWATLLQVIGRWPFRCRSCRSRFYRFAPPAERD
jgi:hypothetical protein